MSDATVAATMPTKPAELAHMKIGRCQRYTL